MITIIFDVDGTLVESTGFDSELYIRAIHEVLGNVHIHNDWNAYTHVTDAGILNQIFAENKINRDDKTFNLIRARCGELIKEYLAKTSCKPRRGAIEAIRSLADNSNYRCGIATGGWGHTAEMKLLSAGIDITGLPFYSCDHHHERTLIMRQCYNHASHDNGDAVYVGDGPWDIVAARQLHWGFIGVGHRLKGKTNIWISDFFDPNWKDAPEKALQL